MDWVVPGNVMVTVKRFLRCKCRLLDWRMFDNGINGPITIINSKPVHKYHTIARSTYRPSFFTPVNEVCKGYVFTGVCLSTGGCACSWGGGCDCSQGVPAFGGGVPGPTGVPAPRGAWSRGVWSGGWVPAPWGSGLRGVPDGDSPMPPIPPDDLCCGRYASYWNAFLFLL